MISDEYDLKVPDDPTAQDAEWKKIQQNTFTRWCNEHLKCVNLYIYNLETDLSDGLKLIALLQVLSHKKIEKYNKRPTFKSHKLENITIALNFIASEDIKVVNIDSSHIVSGNLKLILGLIWTLILKYQISLPMMDDEGDTEGGQVERITPKQALMGWVKSKLPAEVPINNFNKDWCNGIAVAALVEAIAPGLFPSWDDLDPKNALENAKEAMKLAEDWLGVPQVITPEEITNNNVDELSVMTYVSYFPEAKLKPGAPLKRKMNEASKCSAYGPGLQENGVIVNKPADFTVNTTGASHGKINVQVFGPGRKVIDCNVQDNHDNTYSCQYIAPKVGVYDVHVRVGGHHIPKSPFRVNVASDLDSSKVSAYGKGLELHGLIVGQDAPFEVNASEAGNGDLSVVVIDPTGAKKTELKIEALPNSIYKCSYVPLLMGRYVIVIKYGGKEVAKSPYHVNVTPASDRVKIYGSGLEPGLKTGKPAVFVIDCTEAGAGDLDVNIEGPGKNDIAVDLQNNGDGTYTCTYKPSKAGTYTIRVKFNNNVVPKCPVKVSVGSTADPSKIKAWGPGLERGVAGRPAEFFVSCKGAPIANLTVGVEGPGQAKVEIIEDADGAAKVYYYPTAPGKYIIHVMYDEIDIKDSPFTAMISPRGDISKVYADGPGLKEGNMAGKPAEFTVYTKGSGVKGGFVQVFCTDESGNEVDVKVKDNDDGTFTVVYLPKSPGKYTLKIQFMDEDIPKSPIVVNIIPFCDPSKVKATGPGLEGGKCGKPCKFKIDASKAGEGGIDVKISGPKEAKFKCDDNGDGTCNFEYIPVEDGDYKIDVLFADQHIPGSPFNAVVSDEFDASKVIADGPGLKPGNRSGKPCLFTVDTRKAGKAKLAVEVTDEAGKPLPVKLTEEEPGVFSTSYLPEKEGTYKVSITFGGKPIPKSSFAVKVGPASDPSKVKVFGPGIKPTGVKSLEPTYFEVDASEAGDGNVVVDITPTDNKLPKVSDIEIKPGKKPNTYVVTYTLPKHGEFIIKVTFSSAPVPESPFKILATPGCDASKCKVAAFEEPVCGQENQFTVDCPPEAGEGTLSCSIDSPAGKPVKANVAKNNKNGYDVKWTPKEPGPHKITVKYGNNEIPGSPFSVNALDKPDPSKVKAFGPGLKNAFVNRPAEFTIDTKNAGPGNLGLTIEGPEEAQIDCKDNNDGTFSINYIPTTTGQHDVNIMFDGVHIPNSPFKVSAVEHFDASKVKCKGAGVSRGVPASFPAVFTVDATEAGKAPLQVDVSGPGGKVYPCQIKDNKDGTFDCSYVPDKKGRYQVSPKYGGDAVPGAPFNVNGEPSGGDASKVKCSGPGLKRPHIGFPAPFEVDATKAGKGKVNVNAKGPNGKDIPVNIVEEKEGIYAVDYTPEELGPHEIEVLFGGEPVRGSPFKANATPAPALENIKTPVLEKLLEDGPCVKQQFEAPVDCCDLPDILGAQLSGLIITPSGKKEKVDVKDNPDGTFILNYTPKETGKYILHVAYDGIPIPGSPFEFTVTEGGPEKVKVYGKGTKKGIVAVPARFTIDTKNAGPGDLSVAVEGPSKADIECVDNHDGTCEVTYIPVEEGKYDVIVKFDNNHVPGSPFHPVIVQDEPAIEVGYPSDLCLSSDAVNVKDVPNLKGLLSAPSGKEKPCEIKEGPKDSILASFVPEEPGKNLLNIKKQNKPISGLPIPIIAREKPVIGKDSCIPLECTGCDTAKDLAALKGVLRRPNGKEEPCKIEKFQDGVISVNFVPEEPGKHLIKVFKNNKQIDDSPFVVMVDGSPDKYPKVGKPCDKELYLPEPCKSSDISKLKGTLRRPTGKEEPIDVKLGKNGSISVSFVPTEAGEHLISVKKDGKHVPSSPFSIIVIDEPKAPTVGSVCDASFVIPELDLQKDLDLLSGELTRPNHKTEPLPLSVDEKGALVFNFIPNEPGEHLIGIKKRGKHVKDSPFTILVEEAETNPKVGEECVKKLNTPNLDLPRDLPDLKGELQRPSGKREPVKLKVIDDKLSAIFKPEETGEHLLHVNKKGKPIEGSPFKIIVDSPGAEVGQECGVNLAIPDLNLPQDLKYLEAELTDPNGKKKPLKCKEGPNKTLAVDFTPKIPGDHFIDIKKKGTPVPGSPFLVAVGPAKKHKKSPLTDDDDIVPVIEKDVECSENLTDSPTVGSPCDISMNLDDVKLPDDLDKLKAHLTRPSGKREPIKCGMDSEGSLALSFIPDESGLHKIDLEKNKVPVKGSPFEIYVNEASVPHEKGPTVGSPCDVDLSIDGIKLPDDLDKLKAKLYRPSGSKETIPCEMGENGSLALSWTPYEPGKHLISVKKNKLPVAGSPFEIMVEDDEPDNSKKARDKKPKAGSPCGLNKVIDDVKLPEDLAKLTAELTKPSGKKEPIKCKAAPDGSLLLDFTPTEVGKHLVDVKKSGRPVKGSPFEILVDHPDDEKPKVGSPCGLKKVIDDVKLPEDLAKLTAELTKPSGKKEPIKCKAAPDGSLVLDFTPTEVGKHLIDVKKSGRPVKGSPFEVIIDNADEDKPKVGSPCEVNLAIDDVHLPEDLDKLSAELTRPSGKKEPIKCKMAPDGSLALDFTPTEVGKHLIEVKKNGRPVKGSPFEIFVDHPDDEKPKVGSPCGLKKVIDDVKLPEDLAKLTAELTKPSGKKEPIKCKAAPDGSLVLDFTPTEVGKHLIDVKKSGRPVKGSPFEVIVDHADGDKPKVGSPCDVNLAIDDVHLPEDLDKLSAELTRPSGKKEPIKCKMAPDGSLALDFTPTEVGKHLIEVKKNGQPVKGSPFEIFVDHPDDEKPKVGSPCGLKKVIDDVKLPEDLAKLTAELTKPSGKKEPIKCKAAPDGSLVLDFTPTEVGKHLVDVKKSGRPVKGSPFEVIVDHADGDKPKVGSPCDVNLAIDDVHLPEDLDKLSAELTRPSGKKEPIKCKMAPDGSLALDFTPTEVGKHLIDVKKNGRPVKGSPFEIFVDHPDDEKPKVGSPCGLKKVIDDVKLPEDLVKLTAELTKPSGKKEPIKCKAAPDGSLVLDFTPTEVGKHLVDVKKSGRPVKGSPFEVIVDHADGDKPKVGSPCDVNLAIDDVHLPEDLDKLSAELTRPSGKKEPIKCKMAPDGSLALDFTPTEVGKHLIEVKKNGRPVKGSPFEIFVDHPDHEKPKVGSPCGLKKVIDDVKLPEDLAKLTAELTKPSGKKEPIKCKAAPDGSLVLDFTPTEVGKHLVDVKKSGRPVKGSPFEVIVDHADGDKPKVGSPCDVNLAIDDVHLPEDLDKLSAELTRPSGKKEPIKCKMAPDGSLALDFTPTEVGKHLIEVKKNGRPVKGSPFEIFVDHPDHEKPKVGSPCGLKKVIDDVKLPEDLAKLTAELTKPSGKKEPIKCKAAPDGSLVLDFTPTEVGKHLVDVKKSGRPVKGSPFEVFVDHPDDNKPMVGSSCDVNLAIDDVKLPSDLKNLTAELTRPSGKKEPVICGVSPDNLLALSFTPDEPGKHLLSVKKHGIPVKGSPFEVIVEDISRPKHPTVGHKCDVEFSTPDIVLPNDLSSLTAKLTRPNGIQEPIKFSSKPDKSLAFEFTPKESGDHIIDVFKNGHHVKGSPFIVKVFADEDACKALTVGSECLVNIAIDDIKLPEDFSSLVGSLKRPDHHTEEPLELVLNKNNTIGVIFVPEKAGPHVISIKKHGKHVSKSPFVITVEEPQTSAQEPVVGNPVDLSSQLIVKPEDLRFLKGTLTRPNNQEEPIELKLNSTNHIVVNFLPSEPGLHKVSIKRNGKHIDGSPIEIMVGAGKKKPTCDVGFVIPGISLPDDLKKLKGSVVAPNGSEEPLQLQAGEKNTIVISFLPKESGLHYIHIKMNNKHVGASPYEVMVKPEDIAFAKPDASKVKCTGRGLRHGHPKEKATFNVDTRDAGYGGLSLSIEGPSKVDINCVDNDDGTCSVDYTPSEPGTYLINVTYADDHVPGSPFKCRVGGSIGEEIKVVHSDEVQSTPDDMFSDMLAFPSSKSRSPKDFVIKFSGTGDLKATVTRPSGTEDDAEVIETAVDTYTVRFVPRETGEHLVNVRSRRRHIPGSPFKVLVEAPSGGAPACKAHGPGLEGGIAGQPCKFTVITRDAGPGGLAVAVEGPAKAEIQCNDNGDGSCDITWYPVETGEYTVHIRFADEAIPGSPSKVFILPANQGKTMPMESFKDQVLRVGQQASFAVQMKGKKGKISASVESPSNVQIDCNVAELEEGNYAVRFVPRELGDHLVSVYLDGQHIPGSPFTVRVGGLEGDPSKVTAHGQGLKGGVSSKPAEFTVNALDAGSGALALSIDGPAKVKMNCVEQDDGTYKVIYNPTVCGTYEISIRFAGQHIPNSPYKVRIVESEDEIDAVFGDASKCTSNGSGLHRANVGKPATFTVDASNAGRGSIMVGVEGPVVPAKEIHVIHTGSNIYSINYTLVEEGDYIIRILWGDRHIPGSPFHVTV
ncbi:filamin-B isoform X2 [Hydra vulgaris]|uniref:filamin-B isoform X2 n=1 Tax=Hydra vulgaris TaxID=6087 RepID=UPI0032EA383F